MIFRWFAWKTLKLAFLISFLFAFLFFILQITKVDQIIFQLPLGESVPFLLLWFFYYFSYLLPMSLFISYSIGLFELKESKKLYVLQSFGIEPKSLYTRILLLLSPLFLSLLFSFAMLGEEDISRIRKELTIKYYTLIITSIPLKSFQSFGPFTLYVEDREDGELKGVFFRFQEGVIIARRAKVEKGNLFFETGSLLTQKENRTFSTDFKSYRLSLSAVVEKKKTNPAKRYILASLNLTLSAFLMFVAYKLLLLIEHHHRFYYTIGLISLLYQATLLLVKQSF